jgi:hypothetical protein
MITLEERGTQLLLELLYRSADVGLRNVQARRSLAKMQFSRYGHRKFQFLDFARKIHGFTHLKGSVFLGGSRDHRRLDRTFTATFSCCEPSSVTTAEHVPDFCIDYRRTFESVLRHRGEDRKLDLIAQPAGNDQSSMRTCQTLSGI